MNDEAQPEEVTRPGPKWLAKPALRMIDSSARFLLNLRNRIDPKENGDDSEAGRRGHKHSTTDDASADATPAPHKKSFLHRVLVVVMLLLMGGSLGTLVSYRALSGAIDSNKRLIETMKDDIQQFRRDELFSLKIKERLEDEIVSYKRQLREQTEELNDYKTYIAKMNRRHEASTGDSREEAGRPVRRRAPSHEVDNSRTAGPVGECVTDTANPVGSLRDCLDKLNRR